jgi:nitrogen fixation NifU-like protein
MTRQLDDLYPGIVLEHCKRPRNFRVPPHANRSACGDNPLCGDHIDLYVRLEQGAIRDIGFAGVSCAVAKASASLMTEAMMGRSAASGRALLQKFEQMVLTAGTEPDPELGELHAFAEVRDLPSRIQCALLAWGALRNVLQESPA